MGSNGPSKTSDTDQRLPSSVPNDYNHLSVPGSVNMSLNDTRRGRARRRSQARHGRRMPTWLKAMLAMGAGTAAFGVVMLVIFLIAFPPFFRDMEPRYQQRIIDYFPPATYWMPTRPFEQMPTLDGASDGGAAQQLLLGGGDSVVTPDPNAGLSDPVSSPEPALSPTGAEALPTFTPSPTLPPADTGGGIPVGQVGTPLPTPLPTYVPPTQALIPTWTPVLVPTRAPLPASARLTNIKYELQGWNNCGPTTMTMALSYYGWSHDQNVAARWMKPNEEDKNVSPWQMVRFVNEQEMLGNVKALYRVGGTTELLKRLLAYDFPVVIEESIQPSGEGWMGHYVLLIGYDDSQQQFLTYDSYLGYNQGEGRPSPYINFDEHWRHFNRVFMVLYTPDRELALREALGEYTDTTYAYETALEQARTEASRDKEDKWAWFNMGTNYVELGEYQNAAISYDQAFQLGMPFRMLWYQFGPYEAFYEVGDYQNVLAMANTTLNTTKYVEETYYWQGMAYAARGETDNAIERFDTALYYNRNFFPAQEAKALVETGQFSTAMAAP